MYSYVAPLKTIFQANLDTLNFDRQLKLVILDIFQNGEKVRPINLALLIRSHQFVFQFSNPLVHIILKKKKYRYHQFKGQRKRINRTSNDHRNGDRPQTFVGKKSSLREPNWHDSHWLWIARSPWHFCRYSWWRTKPFRRPLAEHSRQHHSSPTTLIHRRRI